MIVIREDVTDWLQRYLFNECGAPPLESAKFLLDRLKSGVWLARLAFKLHFQVISAAKPTTVSLHPSKSRVGPNVRVTSTAHRLYANLRGTGPSGALRNLTPDTLPPFSRPLRAAADTAIGSRETSSSFSVSSNGTTDNIVTQWASRENISSFLEWCHGLGISATVLFETAGLGEFLWY